MSHAAVQLQGETSVHNFAVMRTYTQEGHSHGQLGVFQKLIRGHTGNEFAEIEGAWHEHSGVANIQVLQIGCLQK